MDGIAGNNTWNMAYSQYAALHGAGEIYLGMVTRQGTRGAVVKSMQQKLNTVRQRYPGIQSLTNDGIFGSGSAAGLRQFRHSSAFRPTGPWGSLSFARMRQVLDSLAAGQPVHVSPAYPGYVLQVGSSGDSVRFVQSYLSALGARCPV